MAKGKILQLRKDLSRIHEMERGVQCTHNHSSKQSKTKISPNTKIIRYSEKRNKTEPKGYKCKIKKIHAANKSIQDK